MFPMNAGSIIMAGSESNAVSILPLT